jgi:processive 1,2-diacylglycerol beta-glucosyltransferase
MEQRKKILFLPFLQIPSGHHQTANALIDGLNDDPTIETEKIDILSYGYGKIESLVSQTYLKWIQLFPELYNWIYRKAVYTKSKKLQQQYRTYELLFLHMMRKMINEKRPDLIVCTHALPSYMLNKLKQRHEFNIPIINVYTDYFIHSFWGINYIDYHFTPSLEVKNFLLQRGVGEEQIYSTGIPIHKEIKKSEQVSIKKTSQLTIMITGGNLGVGAIENLVQKTGSPNEIHYYVLCGKNKALYDKLCSYSSGQITPLPFIECRKQMNEMYDSIDGIVTKPGGVTISESLFKRKPIFIYDALPGQEQINVEQLSKLGVILHVNKQESIDKQIHTFFNDDKRVREFESRLDQFHKEIDCSDPSLIVKQILKKTSCPH